MKEREKPKCIDTRPCCFRNEDGKCEVLQETYKTDGKCRFCKESLNAINGLEGQREKEPEKPKPKKKPLVVEEVLMAISEKLKYVANEHGAYWTEYADILRKCEAIIKSMSDENDALSDVVEKLREKHTWKPIEDEMPADNTLLIATVIIDDMPEIRSGVYWADEGFSLDGTDTEDVLAWIEVPDPWEGAYETEESTEPDASE